jgi:hypothetical protein
MTHSRCRNHRQALAGWSCDICRAKLCVECVAEKIVDTVSVEVCGGCEERVARIVVHRADALSYSDRLRKIWRYPFSFGGIVGMVGIGILFAIGVLGPLYLALAFAIFWGFIFVLIQSSARGSDEIDPPDFSTLWESIGAVLFRATLATIASWLPLIVYIWKTKPDFYEALVDPILWLLSCFGLVYAPIAILGAAVRVPLYRVLNPLWLVNCVRQLGRDYWIAVGMLAFLGAVQVFISWIAVSILFLPFPVVPVIAAVTLLTYVPFLMARTVGLLLYVRGDKLGYGDPDDYYERVVVDRPQAQLPAKKVPATFPEAEPPKKEDVRPIEVDF